MHWYEWVFIGVGVLILTVLLEWWRRSRQASVEAGITAQGAKVTKSPVLSGSHNMQTVNAPTIHAQTVNFGHIAKAATPPPAPPPIAKIQKVLPNIKYIGAETVSLREDMFLGLVEDGSQQNAILIRFANEARRDAQNLRARVKAVLIYRYDGKEVDVVGSWLDEGDNVIEIEPDSRRHKLIVGIVIDGEFSAITAKTFVAHRRTWHRSDSLPLKGFQTGVVFVQLTNVQTHDVLFENEFTVSVNPLRIAARS